MLSQTQLVLKLRDSTTPSSTNFGYNNVHIVIDSKSKDINKVTKSICMKFFGK